MSAQEYALSRVRDALASCGGNKLKAKRMIMTWIAKDQSMLLGLMAPHAEAIINHALDHVQSKVSAAAPIKKAKKIDVKDAELGDLGREILKGAGRGQAFGQTPVMSGSSAKPLQASAKHADAMAKIARRVKKDDK